MDDKKEKITAADIFETKIGKLKSTANKIRKKLEKPLLKQTPTSTASRPPGYPGTVQPKKKKKNV